MAITTKGFIKDWQGNKILPITRGELVLDKDGNVALTSQHFLAGENGNLYGLITAAEREVLKGVQSGNNLTDVYTKLGYINSGLTFNNTAVSFYNTSGTATPINVVADPTAGIVIGVANNTVSLGLKELTTSGITVQQIVKNIAVDKYGRVIAVEGGALTTADIPAELVGKVLTDCTVATVGEGTTSIVNKAYVDEKFNIANGIATGALKFGGTLTSSSNLNSILANSSNVYKYYKVAEAGLTISKEYLYDEGGATEIVGGNLILKPGDTLIVYPASEGTGYRFVYIPSADDYFVTVNGTNTLNSSTSLSNRVHNMSLNFGTPFIVSVTTGSTSANITLNKASDTNDGYLSSDDYKLFKQYATQLAVSYEGATLNGGEVYTIGTLKIGESSYTIQGKTNLSALALVNGAVNEYNPILRFTENGINTDLTLKGLNGIAVRKNGDSIEISSLTTVNSGSESYLTVSEGHKIGVQLGRVNEDGTYNEGLVNFSTVHSLATQVGKTTVYEEIDYTLIGTDSSKYQYGNDKLKAAITLTI